jgi:hypothetical protein
MSEQAGHASGSHGARADAIAGGGGLPLRPLFSERTRGSTWLALTVGVLPWLLFLFGLVRSAG